METLECTPKTEEGLYKDEMPGNFEQKCPCIIVADVSTSMMGEPINELNKGLKVFQSQVQKDPVAAVRLETALITFGREVKLVRDFSLFEGNSFETLIANGHTPLAEGLTEAIKLVNERKAWYKSQGLQYYRPFIILITDGHPTSSQSTIDALIQELTKSYENKAFNLWAFGVNNANMKFLERISHPAFPPQKLTGVNFVEFFQWLSNSMGIIVASKSGDKIDITPKANENPFQLTV